jgi:hypothetical protein
MATDPLGSFARRFAKQTQDLLNKTVCTGAIIKPVISEPGTVIVAPNLQRSRLESAPIPVRQGAGKPYCWLDLTYTFCLDDSNEWPMVKSSFFAIRAADTDKTPLCHFDYERDKSGGYPEAHVQVYGTSPALQAWTGEVKDKPLNKFHIPVGGRRYRPILEDVIDFLAVEGLIPELPNGAAEIIAKGREQFNVIQLRSAIRRDLDIARDAVKEFDGKRSLLARLRN